MLMIYRFYQVLWNSFFCAWDMLTRKAVRTNAIIKFPTAPLHNFYYDIFIHDF